ncbi:MAG: shikimate kinase [Acidobacteriaceae bacterium]
MSGPRTTPALPGLSRIVLTGFMGAGKTTVGALLADHLGWQFVDSDRIVEDRAGLTIAGIFTRHGETAFREMEAAAIRDAASGDRLVLALGGGALELLPTREFLASLPACRIVFLEAPLDTLLARCAAHNAGPVRPVLQDRARLAERWQARLPLYRQAHLTISTAGLAPAAVAEQILTALSDPGGESPLCSSAQASGARA